MNYYFDVFKKYAVFSGRARRKEYWMFVLINVAVSIVLFIASDWLGIVALSNPSNGATIGLALQFIIPIYALAVLIPTIAVTVRRLHDTNRSGAWIFIELVALVGWIILLIFTVQDSNPGDNQYGPNPKGVAAGGQ